MSAVVGTHAQPPSGAEPGAKQMIRKPRKTARVASETFALQILLNIREDVIFYLPIRRQARKNRASFHILSNRLAGWETRSRFPTDFSLSIQPSSDKLVELLAASDVPKRASRADNPRCCNEGENMFQSNRWPLVVSLVGAVLPAASALGTVSLVL